MDAYDDLMINIQIENWNVTYPVHPDCGATRPFDFKTQTTSVQYWLGAKLLFKKRPLCVRPGSNPQNELYTPATTSSTRWSTTQPRIAFCRSTYIVPYKKPLRAWLIV